MSTGHVYKAAIFLSERAFDAMFQAMATLDIFQELTS